MIKKTFSIIGNRNEIKNQKSWENRCSAFRNALECESNWNHDTMTWLMTTILGISQYEANKRHAAAEELKNNDEFKIKKETLIERVYLNENNVPDLKH